MFGVFMIECHKYSKINEKSTLMDHNNEKENGISSDFTYFFIGVGVFFLVIFCHWKGKRLTKLAFSHGSSTEVQKSTVI